MIIRSLIFSDMSNHSKTKIAAGVVRNMEDQYQRSRMSLMFLHKDTKNRRCLSSNLLERMKELKIIRFLK